MAFEDGPVPQLLAVPAIGDGQDDCLVLPALAGTLIENPAENWRKGQSVTLTYPGNLSPSFWPIRIGRRRVSGRPGHGRLSMSLAWRNRRRFFDAGTNSRRWRMKKTFTPGVQSPYPVALGVTQGSWCDTADQYKRWALQQKWCAQTLAQRRDIPAWWKDGPDVHVCEVRTYDGTRTCTGSYYPKLHDHLRTFRDKIDGPSSPCWPAGEPPPLDRRDYFRSSMRTKRGRSSSSSGKTGLRPFFFLSGLFSTYWNEGATAVRLPGAEVFGVVCHGRKQRQTERVRAERIQPAATGSGIRTSSA